MFEGDVELSTSDNDDDDNENDKSDEELSDIYWQNKSKAIIKPKFSGPMPGKSKAFTLASDSSE